MKWFKERVYEEINNVGQEVISVRWVIIPKLINGRTSSKVRIVA